MVIAIDGPAGSGKSTVARQVAERLGATLLDSGAMYRCVALAALREPAADPGELASRITIALGDEIRLENEDVTREIRTPEVSALASQLAARPDVRRAMVAEQRRLLSRGDWVAEGRDIGTVVAPQAEVKVFLTAAPEERARRRAAELGRDPDEVLLEQTERDERDRTRADSPLRAAEGSVEFDTTGLSIDEVVALIAGLAAEAKR